MEFSYNCHVERHKDKGTHYNFDIGPHRLSHINHTECVPEHSLLCAGVDADGDAAEAGEEAAEEEDGDGDGRDDQPDVRRQGRLARRRELPSSKRVVKQDSSVIYLQDCRSL